MKAQLPVWLAIATILTYAAGYPLGSASVAVMPFGLVLLLRFSASAVVLWGLVAALRIPLPSRQQLLHCSVAGLMIQGVQFTALYWALQEGVSAGLASLLIALNPVTTSVLLLVMGQSKEDRRGVVSLVLALAAVVCACAPRIAQDHSIGLPLIGVGVALAGLTVGGIYQGRLVRGTNPLVITAVAITASIPIAALATILMPGPVEDWTRGLAIVGAMVIISSVAATTLYSACIHRAGARAASILFAIIPATASLMAWVTLGEAISGFTIIGIILGAAACLISLRPARTPQ
ncbi:DMT family transporter [Corynebacterium sp. 320]|uniref:DMT family transporter n=1 Tax=Corynebacterium TaxID=1716 RepID=UPI00125CB017|nr:MULTISPECIES: DMT family transporter [Corynebacterium]KAB1503602.1 DMT family transporter [Corynebacterium sp. 320]KAB1553297.1 DMT family transporter [Corynebacterium sp. 321]KAB3527738.1 DMT family transporter [Corynebacterium sp. 250]QNP92959.1 DMT family transporter [Corynebacterium zhongnanshanii]